MKKRRIRRSKDSTQPVRRRPRLLHEQLEDRRVLTAMLQVVHNSPYSEAALVDVYANDELLLNDFAFRDASPFVEVPSGVDIKLDILAVSEAGTTPVYSTTVNLADETYVAMAAGDPLGREGQPAFGLAVTDMGRVAAEAPENAEFLVVHGSPDAPTVDIVARGVGTLVDDLSYPEYAEDYLSVAPGDYIIDITPGDDDTTVVASFQADLSEAAGAALVVAASGFLAPADEADPSFGLLAVFADGTTALLPAAAPDPATLQVIHNSPYAEAALVDVYANDELLLNDFAFRDASPFVEVPSGVDIKLDITAADAEDNSAPVFTATVNLDSETYVAMAAGDPLGREGQPAFGLAVTDMGTRRRRGSRER